MREPYLYIEYPTRQERREAQWEELLANLVKAGSSIQFIELMYRRFWGVMAFFDGAAA